MAGMLSRGIQLLNTNDKSASLTQLGEKQRLTLNPAAEASFIW
jgi:hypothetical protein